MLTQPFLHQSAVVDFQIVEHQEDLPLRVAHQSIEKLYEPRREHRREPDGCAHTGED